MRFGKFSAYILLMICFLYSCGQQETKKRMKTYGDSEREFVATLTEEDTLEVLALGKECMDSLKNGNIHSALEKLYMLKGHWVMPLDDANQEMLESHFQCFPVIDYNLDYWAFSTQGCNDLKYRIAFEKADASGYAPMISFALNPVKIDGHWFLCVKGKEQFSREIMVPREKNSPAPVDVEFLK